tara:strand:+ start:996 stop:3674 length:2679 start_codon:yes stop_codon:yes gene_type:complete
MNTAIFFNAPQMANLTIILGFMGLLIILGTVISLKTTTPSSFMLGNRSFAGWLLAFSIVGTNVSSLAFLAYPAKGYNLDFSIMFANLGANFLSLTLTGVFFVRFLRRTPSASIYSLLEHRFGSWASIFASVAFIAAAILRMGVIMCLVAKALHMISGSNVGGVIILCGIIVIFYTYMSGIEGVIWTDLIQTAFLIIAGIASFLFIKAQLPEGFASIINIIPKTLGGGKEAVQSSIVPVWVAFFYFLVLGCAYFMTDQAIAQRYIAARSVRAAKNSTFISALLMPFAVGLFFAIGIALYAFYNNAGGVSLPSSISGDADKVFIYFITQSIPDGLKGLMIIGILSAAMSTIDSGINSSATVFITNIYHPHIRRSKGKQEQEPSMDVLRRSSLLFGIVGIFVGYLVFLTGESVLDVFWRWLPVIKIGIFGLFLLMRVSSKVGPIAGGIATIVGVFVTAWISFTAGTDLPFAPSFHYMLNCPIGLGSMVITGLCLSFFLKRKGTSEEDTSHVGYDQKTGEEYVERPVDTEYHLIKQNALVHALTPNPYYRLLGLGGVLFYALMLLGTFPVSLVGEDKILFTIGFVTAFSLTMIPRPQRDSQSKYHSLVVLVLMGLSFPLIGAVGFFAHPEELFFNYFFMATITILGAFSEWVVLGFLVSISTCAATMIASALYSRVGIPENWLFLTAGCLGIMTLYAMSSARRSFREREKLEGIAMITKAINQKDRGKANVLHQLIPQTATFLEQGVLEREIYPIEDISIKECLLDALEVYPFHEKVRSFVKLKVESDFTIQGNRILLMNSFLHLMDNAAHYLHNGEAETLVCRVDGATNKIHFEDDGPGVPPANIPYIFELFFGSGKLSAGMGLTYCRKALKFMGASIHLTSGQNSGVTEFTVSF